MTITTIPKSLSGFNHIVAFEVAKAELLVHILPEGEGHKLPNSAAAVRRLLKREAKHNATLGLGPLLVICEATGGYERHVLDVANDLGLASHRAHGSAVRDYAKFKREHSKTDAIDVVLIAKFGRDSENLRLYQPPSPNELTLRELTARRSDLKATAHAELCRLEHIRSVIVIKSIKGHLQMLGKQIADIEAAIARLLAEDQAFAHKSALMQTLTGIGPVSAATILAYLPEIGQVPRGTIAKLAGLAPIANDSGKKQGPRHIFAGRAEVRKCLYMAAVAAMRANQVMRDFASRLTANGKPFYVVATAVMRKMLTTLNAIIEQDQPWKFAKTT